MWGEDGSLPYVKATQHLYVASNGCTAPPMRALLSPRMHRAFPPPCEAWGRGTASAAKRWKGQVTARVLSRSVAWLSPSTARPEGASRSPSPISLRSTGEESVHVALSRGAASARTAVRGRLWG